MYGFALGHTLITTVALLFKAENLKLKTELLSFSINKYKTIKMRKLLATLCLLFTLAIPGLESQGAGSCPEGTAWYPAFVVFLPDGNISNYCPFYPNNYSCCVPTSPSE